MRIWDIHPGYLNRNSLLGEHSELHGLVNVLTGKNTGYAKHPEALRWTQYGWALKQRHALLAAEMALRGYKEATPVLTRSAKGRWPSTFLDTPLEQMQILKAKYKEKQPGRISLPKNAQQFWSHHKYSVMARDQRLYKSIGQRVSRIKSASDFGQLMLEITDILRTPPPAKGVINALQHMWGYVSHIEGSKPAAFYLKTPKRLLLEIQKRAQASNQLYLRNSTALSELFVYTH